MRRHRARAHSASGSRPAASSSAQACASSSASPRLARCATIPSRRNRGPQNALTVQRSSGSFAVTVTRPLSRPPALIVRCGPSVAPARALGDPSRGLVPARGRDHGRRALTLGDQPRHTPKGALDPLRGVGARLPASRVHDAVNLAPGRGHGPLSSIDRPQHPHGARGKRRLERRGNQTRRDAVPDHSACHFPYRTCGDTHFGAAGRCRWPCGESEPDAAGISRRAWSACDRAGRAGSRPRPPRARRSRRGRSAGCASSPRSSASSRSEG